MICYIIGSADKIHYTLCSTIRDTAEHCSISMSFDG